MADFPEKPVNEIMNFLLKGPNSQAPKRGVGKGAPSAGGRKQVAGLQTQDVPQGRDGGHGEDTQGSQTWPSCPRGWAFPGGGGVPDPEDRHESRVVRGDTQDPHSPLHSTPAPHPAQQRPEDPEVTATNPRSKTKHGAARPPCRTPEAAVSQRRGPHDTGQVPI